MLPSHIISWFASRKLRPETLEKFNVSWNGSQIVIPIKNPDGKTLFNKYRRDPNVETGPKYQNQKGSSAYLFNFNPDWNEVVIVEGELDCMLLSQYNINCTTSTGGAGTFPKLWRSIFENKKVYIFVDNDAAGWKSAIRINAVIPHALIIPHPRHWTGKDVTDFFRQHSLKEFNELKDHAYHLRLYADTLKEVKKELEYCVILRRSLNGSDLSTDILEEYVRQLNVRKEQLARTHKYIKKSNEIEELKKVPMDRIIMFNPAGFAPCPFHNEKTPSFKYYPATNTGHCFGCNQNADVIDIVQKLKDCSFTDALTILKKL